MNLGPVQIIIIALVVLVLFGRGRISEMMGDFGKGMKSFRKGLSEDETPQSESSSGRIEGPSGEVKSAADAQSAGKPTADKSN